MDATEVVDAAGMMDEADVMLDRPHWADREPPDIDPEDDVLLAAYQPTPGTPVIDPDSAPGARLALDIEYAAALAAQLTDTQLLEVVAGIARHRNWLAALEHRMIAAYADRHPRDSQAVRPGAASATPTEQWVPDELGLVLAVSRERARGIITDAQRLTHVLPGTLDALQSGVLDQSKVDTVLRATDVLDSDQAQQVEAIVLAKVAGATRRQVYDRLRRAVAKVDPHGTRRRHQRSLVDRRIGLSHGDDGMATLWLTGSAHDTQASWQSLDRLARSLGAGDPRTLEQRRVDLAHQLLQGTLAVTDLGQVHAAVDSLLAAGAAAVSADTATADAARTGAVGANVATDTAAAPADAEDGPTSAHADDTISTRADDTGSAHVDETGSARVDHTAVDATTDPTGAVPIPPHISSSVLAEAVVRALAQKPDPNETIGRKPLIQVVVALDTLIGAGDRPAELTGHGPIPATTARALAAGGVWRQLVTDSTTGRIHSVGRTTYSPPAAMADHVRARDGHCRGPACDHTIRDLDHHVPWARGGQTSEDNLHGYCRGCHTLKDRPGWQVLAHPDGTVQWISPHGWTSTSHPRDYRDLTDPYPEVADAVPSRTPETSAKPGRPAMPDPADSLTGPGASEGCANDPAPF
ncbi:uncharacterized protein DUF222 [Pseudonocardia autotrophica]|uniref:HNH nuclease domain-containing protein n=3 Tax=Pseudonocardiaceae TaxID=2070 RepID=A0A1Y2N6T0_PSEAH|nr:hypothetical protein BG845_00768 [Pseudonocardia autotrophica]TDN71651.1 uncharacterized protein DUF222 [Pseudonocardia autotrophica]